MSKPINFYKVVALPATLQPNAFYLVRAAENKFDLYVTDDNSAPSLYELNVDSGNTLWSEGVIFRDLEDNITSVVYDGVYEIAFVRNLENQIIEIVEPNKTTILHRDGDKIVSWNYVYAGG